MGAIAALVLAAGVAGCGGGSAAGTARAEQSVPSTVATRGEAAVSCPASVREFAAGLERLRHRLVAGLTYAEYVGAVKRLRGSYGAIDVERLAPACLIAAGTPAERAFDVYIEAANVWGECLSEAGCDAGDVEATLQGEWKVASRQLADLRLR